MCCRIADLLPKRRNAQNRFPLYGFGAILGVFFRYERLCFDGGILYRQPFKSRCLSLPGNKKAPYCYDAFVLLGRWSKGTLFNYLLYFFFLLTTVVPMAAPPLTNSKAIHKARLLVSPVWGGLESSFSFAVTVSAFLISLVPSLSLKYLPQPSQYQYSILPSVVLVAAFAGKCFKLVWFFGSSSPYSAPHTSHFALSLQVAFPPVCSVSFLPQ